MPIKPLSAEVLEVIPRIMCNIRTEMREVVQPSLTIAQFRILKKLFKGTQTNKQLAEWLEITTPSMSRMIDALVKRGFILREFSKNDRREVKLCLTSKGKNIFEKIKSSVKNKIEKDISKLPEDKKSMLAKGLEILREVFKT